MKFFGLGVICPHEPIPSRSASVLARFAAEFVERYLRNASMWTQIVGKVRLALTPKVNHWWNVPLYVSSRGLTTSQMPYGDRALELWFDFIDHQLVLQSSDGLRQTLPLAPRSVADFYQQFMDMLRSGGFEIGR